MTRSSPRAALATLLSLVVLGCSAAGGQAVDQPARSERGKSLQSRTDGLTGCKGKASSSIPSSGDYYLTSFGNGTHDDGVMSCGEHTKHGTWYYAASRQRYGCGSRIRIEANAKCVVAETDDYGPDVCVENAAGMPIIDASPLVAQHLFGSLSAGYSDKFAVHVTQVDAGTPLGPCGAAEEPGTGGSASDGSGGSVPPGAGGTGIGCGAVTYEGTCEGEVLWFCDGQQAQMVDCASYGASCEWSTVDGYYDCFASGTGGSGGTAGTGGFGGTSRESGSGGSAGPACGYVDEVGECSGDLLSYCDAGNLVTFDCFTMGESCGYDAQLGYYGCVSGSSGGSGGADSGCGEIGEVGDCEGDVLRYCSAGELVTIDCLDSFLTCGWNSAASYYDCL